jgi:hypothetical protein
MRSKWEVEVYARDVRTATGFAWRTVYRGESLLQAFRAARKVKTENNAVRVSWR